LFEHTKVRMQSWSPGAIVWRNTINAGLLHVGITTKCIITRGLNHDLVY
jgi:hypothetical protein